MHTRDFFVWVEKYRPQTLADCILPKSVQQTLESVLQQGSTPNLLFTGSAGVGKTTVAKALTKQLDADVLVINASDERNIDTLRTTIRDFASSMSMTGKRRYVILDEADYLNPQSTQPALRGFMEEFAQMTGFILTCNFANRLIAPLHSRCSVVDFRIPSAERPEIAAAFAKRAITILTQENVTFTKATVLGVVQMYFPDFRRILNELQRFSGSGTLSEAILSQLSDKDVSDLFTGLKSKDYGQVRKWVVAHEDADEAAFYRMLLEQLPNRVDAGDVSGLIVMLADYSYRSAFAADKQLNQLACLVEVMNGARFK